MLLTLALCALGSVPPAPVQTSVEHAGFLRDAHVAVTPRQHLVFEARVEWPVTLARRSFLVEGLAADGSVVFTRRVTASTAAPVARPKRAVAARFDLDLPALDGVQELHVRPAP